MSALFPAGEAAPAWARVDAGTSKVTAVYRHRPSGWEIQHCGHPTALWPYSLRDPAAPGDVIVTHNGRGFRTLVDAKQAVADILDGHAVATAEGCVAGVRRVVSTRGAA